jgi:hypothetical protein
MSKIANAGREFFLFLKGDNEMHSSTRYQKGFLFLGLLLAGRLGLAGGAWAVEVGEKAPDFKLPATTGVDISLSDFRGKKWVLLEFYGADFQPT